MSNVLDHYPKLVPVLDAKQREALEVAAAADDHRVIAATHIIEKDGEIAGYVSLNMIPTVHSWFRTDKIKARDSVMVVGTIENMFRAQNARVLCFPVGDQSPFLPVVESFGYQNILKTNLCVKKL